MVCMWDIGFVCLMWDAPIDKAICYSLLKNFSPSDAIVFFFVLIRLLLRLYQVEISGSGLSYEEARQTKKQIWNIGNIEQSGYNVQNIANANVQKQRKQAGIQVHIVSTGREPNNPFVFALR
ncbi:hypothetical protein HELRODRAFT_160648 [Helobdella robusta]|uniref:Uncharacterized protein n=1 Tax=Helobdella robusta TaxID=6412 RepID=T1EQJ9_HELRO|nr:hypothetical protein HELRODRAFT_160648 [Helobdella robusta]ESO06475.1 hypothetical protein HELRODRAFT_160648 [Helobdella robusta]